MSHEKNANSQTVDTSLTYRFTASSDNPHPPMPRSKVIAVENNLSNFDKNLVSLGLPTFQQTASAADHLVDIIKVTTQNTVNLRKPYRSKRRFRFMARKFGF